MGSVFHKRLGPTPVTQTYVLKGWTSKCESWIRFDTREFGARVHVLGWRVH